MGTPVDNEGPHLRVMFFECGEFGGSVRSLANMLRGLSDLGCEVGLISHFRRTGPVDLGSLECVHKNYCLDLPARVRPTPDMTVRTLGIPHFTRFGLRYLWLAFRALIRLRPQIVYLNNGPGNIPAIIAARMLRIPVVCHLRSITKLSSVYRFCFPFVQRFITLTQFGQCFYQEQGIPTEKIFQLYDPIDVAEFDRKSEVRMDSPKMADGAIYVVQVGTLREHKRPDLAIEAFILAKSESPNLKLILAGDGPMRNELEQMVRKHGFNDSVIFLGRCGQIPALLKRCHIGMLLSRNEGLGLVFLEYMAARLSVVTWAMPVIDELVKDNQNGLVVPEPSAEAIAQALVRLCHSSELRAKMGKAGREFVTSGQFSPESHVQKIHSILKDVAQFS